ncbi:MAG: TerB family tellurite resistance protein [Pseudomonadota bacterium]
MLPILKQLFSGVPSATSTIPDENDNQQLQNSMAALMVKAAKADGEYTPQERAIIEKAMASSFSLANDTVIKLVDDAEAAADSALDMHQFTKNAKKLPQSEKLLMVETLWKIILSDAKRDPYEDAFMRRLCGLIYVSDRENGEARQRALHVSENN